MINFLDKNPELYTGHQFTTQVNPPEKFTHEVELNDPNFKELKCKPYPASGIRLAQLKDAIGELVEKGILVKGDSNFLSPCFFVTKKATGSKTASRGCLCYDYRQCFGSVFVESGSGSGSSLKSQSGSGFRIRIPDPDPGSGFRIQTLSKWSESFRDKFSGSILLYFNILFNIFTISM